MAKKFCSNKHFLLNICNEFSIMVVVINFTERRGRRKESSNSLVRRLVGCP